MAWYKSGVLQVLPSQTTLFLLLVFFSIASSLLLPYVENGTECFNSSITGCICEDVYFGQRKYYTQGCVTDISDLDETCCTPSTVTTFTLNSTTKISAVQGTIVKQGSTNIGRLYHGMNNVWKVTLDGTQLPINVKENDVVTQSYSYKLWTFTISSTNVTANQSVTVAQGASSGVLHVSLTGGSQTSIIVRALSSVTFDTSAALNIGGTTTIQTSSMIGNPSSSSTISSTAGRIQSDLYTIWTIAFSSQTFATAAPTQTSSISQDNGYEIWTVPISSASYTHGQGVSITQANGVKTWTVTLTEPLNTLSESKGVAVSQSGGNTATGTLKQVLTLGQSYTSFLIQSATSQNFVHTSHLNFGSGRGILNTKIQSIVQTSIVNDASGTLNVALTGVSVTSIQIKSNLNVIFSNNFPIVIDSSTTIGTNDITGAPTKVTTPNAVGTLIGSGIDGKLRWWWWWWWWWWW